jgi:hypothetical protein
MFADAATIAGSDVALKSHRTSRNLLARQQQGFGTFGGV